MSSIKFAERLPKQSARGLEHPTLSLTVQELRTGLRELRMNIWLSILSCFSPRARQRLRKLSLAHEWAIHWLRVNVNFHATKLRTASTIHSEPLLGPHTNSALSAIFVNWRCALIPLEHIPVKATYKQLGNVAHIWLMSFLIDMRFSSRQAIASYFCA